jgi:hypothetical protein
LLGVHVSYDPRTRHPVATGCCLEGFDGFVTSTAAPIATGWSDPVAGRESHPLRTITFIHGAPGGIPDTLFLNAHSINSVPDIVGPLRKMGIPAVAAVDLDLITDDQKATFTNLLRVAAVPDAVRETLSGLRSKLAQAYVKQGSRPKLVGVDGLTNLDDRRALQKLIADLAQYGIFPATVGQLENWLPALGILPSGTRHGPKWVESVFVKMGEDPTAPDYVRPVEGDVWDFIREVKRWVENPNRDGIPDS